MTGPISGPTRQHDPHDTSLSYSQVDKLGGVNSHGAVILLSKLYCMNNGFELHYTPPARFHVTRY